MASEPQPHCEPPGIALACRLAIGDLLEDVLRQAPHADHARGALYYSAGLFGEAAEELTRALAARPTAKGYHLLGLCRVGQARWAQALQSFRRALRIDRGLYAAHFELATIHRRRGRCRAAVRTWRAALPVFEGTPYEAYVHSELGLLCEQMGDLDGAIEMTGKAAASGRSLGAGARVNLALLFYKAHRLTEARELLDRLLPQEPRHRTSVLSPRSAFIAHLTLGCALFRAGEIGSARDRLARAVQLSPLSAPAWTSLAAAEAALGSPDAAARALSRALHLSPGFEPALRNQRALGAGEALGLGL